MAHTSMSNSTRNDYCICDRLTEAAQAATALGTPSDFYPNPILPAAPSITRITPDQYRYE